MMRFLRSQRGSSSILVAMVLIILVVLAALSVSTSSVNYRLAKKNAETTQVFYSLDSEGQRVLFDIKKSLKESGMRAEETLAAIQKGNISGLNLPDSLKTGISRVSQQTTSPTQEQLELWYSELVVFYARTDLEEKYPGCLSDLEEPIDLTNEDKSKLKPGFQFKRTIILSVGEDHRYLNLSIKITNPAMGESLDSMCQIEEWRLWQEPFEYSNKVDLWEGNP